MDPWALLRADADPLVACVAARQSGRLTRSWREHDSAVLDTTWWVEAGRGSKLSGVCLGKNMTGS